jgi:methylmalonyl-CoA/ethylmalonyl-CoA epimerase
VRTPTRLHHVGIVVPSEQQAAELIALLDLEEEARGFVESYRALCIFTQGNGGSPLELVVPCGGQLTKFNRGIGGLHHVAIKVDSLHQLTERLRGDGIPLLENQPVRGAGPFICNFLAPVYTRGVIVEFVEESPALDGRKHHAPDHAAGCRSEADLLGLEEDRRRRS